MAQAYTHTLPNGLRIVFEPNDSAVVHCGLFICAGTRHEPEEWPGLAHFCEHLTFKGTHHRSSTQIISALERYGGDLNAYTNKDETVYYATTLRQHFGKAMDVLADIVFNSRYEQADIEKEVEVVADEVDSYKDTPADLIFDEFEAMVFEGDALGRDILGDVDRLRQATTDVLTAYTTAHYRPTNTTAYVYGNLTLPEVVRTIERVVHKHVSAQAKASPSPADASPPASQPSALPPYTPQHRRVDKQTHQAHVVVGQRAVSARHDDFPALYLLNNYLGGPGMSSRLNLALRERHGLVYQVDSNLSTYTNTGVWTVYFGCDKADVRRCLRLVHRELQTLCHKPLTATTLRRAVEQIIGQLYIAMEHNESYALGMAKTYAHFDTLRDIPAFCDRLRQLTPEAVHQVAQRYLSPAQLSTLIYT